MKNSWDVIVVGAGPAGAITAHRLAQSGVKTLLIERARLPRDKICAGIISQQSQVLLEEEFGPDLQFPDALCAAPSPGLGAKIQRKRGGSFREVPEIYHNTWRRNFDYWLTIKAQEAGADLRTETRFVKLEKEPGELLKVHLKGRSLSSGKNKTMTETCRYLVGADGGVSRVRRQVLPTTRVDTPYEAIHQTYVEGSIDLDPHYFYMFWDTSLPYLGYSMCKDDLVMAGVSCPRGSTVRAFLQDFIFFLTEKYGLTINKQVRNESCIMPRFYSLKKMLFNYCFGDDRVLLTGEAAGLFDLTMEGIPAAITSGRNAALSIIEVLGGNNEALPVYEKSMKPVTRALLRGFQERQAKSFEEKPQEKEVNHAAQ